MSWPVVTVIVTHHLDENRPYLEACLRGLLSTIGVELEVLVLSDAETCPDVPPNFTLVHARDLNTATKKAHHGIAMADPRTKYYLFLSDDVVVGPKTIASLVRGVGDMHAICNPMSNSDNGGQFLTALPWGCQLELKDLEDPVEASARAGGLYGTEAPLLVARPYVCFYCTLIPKKVWDMVGPLDARLEVRHNDQDYCMRAAQRGIPSYINFGAFALHFGSKTLDKTASTAMRDEASRVFMEKWNGGKA